MVERGKVEGTQLCLLPLSMGFSRQEYWSGELFPSSGDLPNPGMEPADPEDGGLVPQRAIFPELELRLLLS